MIPFEDLCNLGLLTDTEFARLTHEWAFVSLPEELSTIEGINSILLPDDIDFAPFWSTSLFHWETAAKFAAFLFRNEPERALEAHWNVVLAQSAANSSFFRPSTYLDEIIRLREISERAQKINEYVQLLKDAVPEDLENYLENFELYPVERLAFLNCLTLCYLSKRDLSQAEDSVQMFVFSLDDTLPPMYRAAQYFLQFFLEISDQSAAIGVLKHYFSQLIFHHPSSIVRLSAAIKECEVESYAGNLRGSVYRRIYWAVKGIEIHSRAKKLGLPHDLYVYLEYVIATTSAIAGISKIADRMTASMELKYPQQALETNVFVLEQMGDFEKESALYPKLIELLEEQLQSYQAQAAQSKLPIYYHHAAKSARRLEKNEECSILLRKFFNSASNLAASFSDRYNAECAAFDCELRHDFASAAQHYEHLVSVLPKDDYFNAIDAYAHLSRIYAEELHDFSKAEICLASLKNLLPAITKNLDTSFAEFHAGDGSKDDDSFTSTVELWLTKYAFKSTQKTIETLNEVTFHLTSAYRLLEEQKTELQSSNKRLEELNSEKNEILGIAAHDLKNPLTSIILTIGVVRKYAKQMSPDDMRDQLNGIETSALKMRNLISDLLDVNAIESGGVSFELKEYIVEDLLEEMYSGYIERAKAKQIELIMEPCELSLCIFVDHTRIKQITENLVSNAVKYSPHGKRVWLRSVRKGDLVSIEVQDEGPGLSKEDQAKLFGKFMRLTARPTGGESSTGLGLSIVKRFAEAMHGTVRCESEIGFGATFIVELPAKD